MDAVTVVPIALPIHWRAPRLTLVMEKNAFVCKVTHETRTLETVYYLTNVPAKSAANMNFIRNAWANVLVIRAIVAIYCCAMRHAISHALAKDALVNMAMHATKIPSFASNTTNVSVSTFFFHILIAIEFSFLLDRSKWSEWNNCLRH